MNTNIPWINTISWIDDRVVLYGIEYRGPASNIIYDLNNGHEFFSLASSSYTALNVIGAKVYTASISYNYMAILVYDLVNREYIIKNMLYTSSIGVISSIYYIALVGDRIAIGCKISSKYYIIIYDPEENVVEDYFQILRKYSLIGVDQDNLYLNYYNIYIYKVNLQDHSEDLVLRINDVVTDTGYRFARISMDPNTHRLVIGIDKYNRTGSAFYIVNMDNKQVLNRIDIDKKFLGAIHWPKNGSIVAAVENSFVLIDPSSYNYTLINTTLVHPVDIIRSNPSQSHIAVATTTPFPTLEVYRLVNEKPLYTHTNRTVTITEKETHTITYTTFLGENNTET